MEDDYWGNLAQKAQSEGFIGIEESEKFLAEISNAD
jgi:hypothetical protein